MAQLNISYQPKSITMLQISSLCEELYTVFGNWTIKEDSIIVDCLHDTVYVEPNQEMDGEGLGLYLEDSKNPLITFYKRNIYKILLDDKLIYGE